MGHTIHESKDAVSALSQLWHACREQLKAQGFIDNHPNEETHLRCETVAGAVIECFGKVVEVSAEHEEGTGSVYDTVIFQDGGGAVDLSETEVSRLVITDEGIGVGDVGKTDYQNVASAILEFVDPDMVHESA